MKLKRTILAMSTIIATGAIATSVITSCSGVSQSIIDNLVGRGDGTIYGKKSDGSIVNYSFQDAIHSALTDKNSTAAFKKGIVNDALYIWYENRAKGTGGVQINDKYKNNWAQWNKSISDDYDSKVQSYKNQHNSNWPYYFQNEVLDPVGGTKELFIRSQLCDKIRTDFISHVWENTLLGVREDNSSPWSSTNVARNIDVSPAANFGLNGALAKANWDKIDFNPFVNVQYTDGSISGSFDPQKTYSNFFYTLQKTAFDMYFNHAHPVASSMCLWSYKAPTGGLVKIYDGDVIPNQNTSSSSAGNVGDGKPLDTPSYSFPYFDLSHDTTKAGPNEKFQEFANGFNESNHYYNGANDGIGLTNISTDYTDDPGTSCVFLLSQNNSINNAYETFAPEILNLFHSISDANTNETMPVNIINPKSYIDTPAPDIMKNFLFTGQDGENPLPATSNPSVGSDKQKAYSHNISYGDGGTTPTWTYIDGSDGPGSYENLLPNSVIDLASLFENDATNHTNDTANGNLNHDHIRIFNDQSDWYKKGYRYLVSGIRLAQDPSGATPVTIANALPAYLIRNASGVHFEGLYGAPEVSTSSHDDKLTNEKNLLKYRSLYEKSLGSSTAPMGKGLNIVDTDSTSNDSAKAFFTANTDDVILEAINDFNTNSGTTDHNRPWDEILSTDKFNNGKFAKLYDFAKATYQYFWMQEIITNYDSANKKLFAWGAAYAANDKYLDGAGYNPSIYQDIYNNGLGQALPLSMSTGVSTAPSDGTFAPDAKTYYQVCEDNMVTDFVNTAAYPTPLASAASTNTQTLAANISTAYDAWATLMNGSATASDHINPFLPGSYSEHILSTNDYVNALIQTFGGSSGFANSIKSAAYFDYLQNEDYNFFTDAQKGLGNSQIQDAITSQYLNAQMLASNKLSYYMNAHDNSGAPLTFSDYKTGLYNEWNYQNSLDGGFIDNASTHGISDKKITYWNLLASIKYLTINNYANFFKSLNRALGVNDPNDASNPAYIAWSAVDNFHFNPAFATETDISKVYGWNANYNNSMENIYSNTNIDPSAASKTYAENKQYYTFAAMPSTGSSNASDGMGFAGIITQNSHGTIPDAVGTALFTKTKDATASISQRGILHKYGFDSATDFVNWMGTINYDDPSNTGHINKMQSADIDNMATDFDNSFIGFNDTLNHVKSAVTKEDKAWALMGHPGESWGINNLYNNNVLNDSLFIPYNLANAAQPDHNNQATFELNAPGIDPSTPVIKDAPDSFVGSRLRAEQISYADVKNITDDPNLNTHFAAFCSEFGTGVAYSLLVQFANQTENLTDAEHDVIVTVFGSGSGVVVYDRRLNDLLTSKWVKDWKSDN